MRGTIVCSVSDSEEGRSALGTAVDLSRRLGLRLVLAHVARGIGADTTDQEGATRVLARIAAEHGVADAERREAVGDEAAFLGLIAAEEAADMILIGARPGGLLRRGVESRLADQLQAETPVPVLLVPPRARGAARSEAAHETRR